MFKLIKNTRIRIKLLLLTVPLYLIIFALLFMLNFETNSTYNSLYTTLYSEAYVSSAEILNADRDLYQAAIAESEYNLVPGDDATKAAQLADYKENAAQAFERVTAAVENAKGNAALYNSATAEGGTRTLSELYDDFVTQYNNWFNAFDYTTGAGDTTAKMGYFNATRTDINEMTELIDQYVQSASVTQKAIVNRNISTLILGSLIIVLVMGFFTFYLSIYLGTSVKYATKLNMRIADGDFGVNVEQKYKTKDELGKLCGSTEDITARLNGYVGYINEITEVLTAMANGEMKVSLKQDYVGEFASIKDALLAISSSLNSTLLLISDAANSVNMDSASIATASQQVASGATEQAATIQELASSISEVNVKINTNATNAVKAKSIVQRTDEEVQNGTQKMSDMKHAVQAISDSSNEISKVIKMIEDIAFQTNLLALNASVEAARAGEAGKGFAVVASEVRNLASRSADAAKSTSALIETSVQRVSEGTKIMDATSKSLDEIASNIDALTGLVVDIADASEVQASAVAQISNGIEQMSSVVQSNSATAEENAASSEELAAQAATLMSSVEKFTLYK